MLNWLSMNAIMKGLKSRRRNKSLFVDSMFCFYGSRTAWWGMDLFTEKRANGQLKIRVENYVYTKNNGYSF